MHIYWKLREEAGYRCAVPRCGSTGPFDMEHITPWSEERKHEFHNMILLCKNCHGLVRPTKQKGFISKESLRNYKRNLAVINCRYSLFEMRLLKGLNQNDVSASDIESDRVVLAATQSDLLHVQGFLEDGFLVAEDFPQVMNGIDPVTLGERQFIQIANMMGKPIAILKATNLGRKFARKYYAGERL